MANIYKNAKLDLTAATDTTLYTVPSNSRAIVKSILVCDDTNNGSSITVTLYPGAPASGGGIVLFKSKVVAGNATEQLINEPLIMQENEVLEVVAADANRLHITASILEINREDI
jgi:hypothetical protein|tara:strand:- start:44 stop:388 length:345 start_codon:yes stop_codon:yes gene_type:complete